MLLQLRIDFLASKGVHKASKTKGESGGKNVGRLTYPDGTWTPFTCSFAHGQLLSIAQNQALFSLLGTTYGGNGTTTFALPDMRGLEPAGVNYVICLGGVFPSRN